MALTQTEDKAIWLNSKHYTLNGPLRRSYVSRFPSKVLTGQEDYANEQVLSNWIISDQRGGIGKEEMDESVDSDRCWWTNCITDFMNHILLPRLATSISPVVPTITDAGLEAWDDVNNLTNYTYSETGTFQLSRESSTIDTGTYAALITRDGAGGAAGYGQIYQDCANWNNAMRGMTIKVSVRIHNEDIQSVKGQFIVDDGVDTTTGNSSGEGSYETVTVTHTLNAAATRIRLICRAYDVDGGGTAIKVYFDTIDFPAAGSLTHAVNYNGELSWAYGEFLMKMASGRSAFYPVLGLLSTISSVIPSVNGKLYIFLGDSTNYYYMTTAEAFTQSNSANAYWGIHWDEKLFKFNSSGAGAYSTDPDDATPTWTGLTASLADVSDEIESFGLGKDADGNDVIYCATHNWLYVLDFDNDLWLKTAAKLPDHPNGGKGFCYWHDGHYISHGLGVIRYVTGSTASISEAGLLKDDGLPVEYNGEIVKLAGDSALDVMFGLLDSSQTSGNSKSGLYAYTGRGWRCWWADSSNNGAMHDVIVSSAESSYAVYWDVGGVVYYIDIHRGISNAQQLAGTQEYATAGIWISPWFDAGTAAFRKLLKKITTYVKNVDTDETIAIKYRIDKTNTDLDTGWTTLETLNTAGESGVNEEILASGAGVPYYSKQIRLDLARGSTTTNSPDLNALVSSYRKLTTGYWQYTIPLVIDEKWGTTPKEKHEGLADAAASETDIQFIYRTDGTSHYVKIFLPQSWSQVGDFWQGEYTIQAIET